MHLGCDHVIAVVVTYLWYPWSEPVSWFLCGIHGWELTELIHDDVHWLAIDAPGVHQDELPFE